MPAHIIEVGVALSLGILQMRNCIFGVSLASHGVRATLVPSFPGTVRNLRATICGPI